jgi:hypothetical protein
MLGVGITGILLAGIAHAELSSQVKQTSVTSHWDGSAGDLRSD